MVKSHGLESVAWVEQWVAPASASPCPAPRQGEQPCPEASQFSSTLCVPGALHTKAQSACIGEWVSPCAGPSRGSPGTPASAAFHSRMLWGLLFLVWGWDLPVACLHPSSYQSSCGFFIALVIGLLSSGGSWWFCNFDVVVSGDQCCPMYSTILTRVLIKYFYVHFLTCTSCSCTSTFTFSHIPLVVARIATISFTAGRTGHEFSLEPFRVESKYFGTPFLATNQSVPYYLLSLTCQMKTSEFVFFLRDDSNFKYFIYCFNCLISILRKTFLNTLD